MKSTGATFRKYSSAGVDWASWFLGIGLGLTLPLQVTTMRKSDISSVYAVVASVSRLAALTGTFFALVGIFLIADVAFHKGDLVENVGNVCFRAGGKVVEDRDAVATGDEGIGKV